MFEVADPLFNRDETFVEAGNQHLVSLEAGLEADAHFLNSLSRVVSTFSIRSNNRVSRVSTSAFSSDRVTADSLMILRPWLALNQCR